MLLLLLFVARAKAQNDIPLTFEAIEAGTVSFEFEIGGGISPPTVG